MRRRLLLVLSSARRLLCRKAVDLSEGLSEAGVGSEMRPPWVAGRVTGKHQHKQQICSKDCVQGQGQFRYVTIITTSAERGSAMSPLCRIATNETAESRLQINDALVSWLWREKKSRSEDAS